MILKQGFQIKWRYLKICIYLFLKKSFYTKLMHSVIIFNTFILMIDVTRFFSWPDRNYIHFLDTFCLFIFAIDVLLTLISMGCKRFFTSPWQIFDFCIVAIAFIPVFVSISALRTLRVIIVLKLVSKYPHFRLISWTLIKSIPAVGSIIAFLILFFILSGIITTNLFSHISIEYFGDLGSSMLTLFQVMTFDSWASSILKIVLEEQPLAWLFFIPFIIISSYIILSLFIAILKNNLLKHDLHPLNKKVPITKHKEEVVTVKASEIQEVKTGITELKKMIQNIKDNGL